MSKYKAHVLHIITREEELRSALSYIFENEPDITKFVIGEEDALRLLMFISSTQKIHCGIT